MILPTFLITCFIQWPQNVQMDPGGSVINWLPRSVSIIQDRFVDPDSYPKETLTNRQHRLI